MWRDRFLFPQFWFAEDDGGAGGGNGNGDEDPGDGGDDADTKTKSKKKKTGDDEKTVPYNRFKDVNDERKILLDQISELKNTLTISEDEKKTEIEKLTDQLAILTKSFEDEKKEKTRLEIASKFNIPKEFIPRLQGETAEEIEADAKALSEYITENKLHTPGNPPIRPDGGDGEKKFKIEGKTPAQIRKAVKDKKLSATG